MIAWHHAASTQIVGLVSQYNRSHKLVSVTATKTMKQDPLTTATTTVMTIHLEEIATWKTTRRPYLGNGVTLFVLGSSLTVKDTYRGMQSTIGCRSIIKQRGGCWNVCYVRGTYVPYGSCISCGSYHPLGD